MKSTRPKAPDEIDFVVCMRADEDPQYFTDNLRGVCSRCGAAIIFRPYAPKEPEKICVQCAMELAQ
jgi:uncharacterized protein (DUF983 family)